MQSTSLITTCMCAILRSIEAEKNISAVIDGHVQKFICTFCATMGCFVEALSLAERKNKKRITIKHFALMQSAVLGTNLIIDGVFLPTEMLH